MSKEKKKGFRTERNYAVLVIWIVGKSYNNINSYTQNKRQSSLELLNEIADNLIVEVIGLIISNKESQEWI